MANTFNVCVVGPTTLVGETLIEILEARGFPVGDLHVVGQSDAEGESITFQGDAYTVKDLQTFDFTQCDLAFFCVDASLAQEFVPEAVAAGAIVIDDSDAFRHDEDVPLVVPEVNPDALAGYEARRIIANPNSCAIIMALALKPINDRAGLSRVDAVTLQSVSGAGREAVQELAQQAMGLFNQKPMETEVFAKQIAFNLLPQIGSLDSTGQSREETKIQEEFKRLLQNDHIRINVTAIRVPVFYGHSVALHIETQSKLAAEAAREVLENAPGIMMYEHAEGGGFPTPVVEAAENDPVFIGRLREDNSRAMGLDLWAVADNMRKGGALNMVQIAEKLVEKYLS